MENQYARQLVEEAKKDRRGAVERVRRFAGVRAAFPILIELLREAPVNDLRATAAEALGSFRDDTATDELIYCVQHDRSWHIRNAAVKALGKIGSRQAIKGLRLALEDKAYGVREDARLTLERLLSK
jgi:HEAT repeat protein